MFQHLVSFSVLALTEQEGRSDRGGERVSALSLPSAVFTLPLSYSRARVGLKIMFKVMCSEKLNYI